jgi:hypothetical protein
LAPEGPALLPVSNRLFGAILNVLQFPLTEFKVRESHLGEFAQKRFSVLFIKSGERLDIPEKFRMVLWGEQIQFLQIEWDSR